MALSLDDQATLAAETAFRGRIEAALARYAAYQNNLPAGHAEKQAALVEWSRQVASDAAARQQWINRTVWYGVSAALDANLADLAAARATAFDAALKAAIETRVRKDHGIA